MSRTMVDPRPYEPQNGQVSNYCSQKYLVYIMIIQILMLYTYLDGVEYSICHMYCINLDICSLLGLNCIISSTADLFLKTGSKLRGVGVKPQSLGELADKLPTKWRSGMEPPGELFCLSDGLQI